MSGKNWKDDPFERSQPVRARMSFLDERGYPDPRETRIQFELVSLIRECAEAKKLSPEGILRVLRNNDQSLEAESEDISRILRGNVASYSLSFLMMVLAGLGHDISIAVQGVKGNGRISLNGRHIA
jgi:hypothetical protein